MDYSREFSIAKSYYAKVKSSEQRGIPFELSIAQYKRLMLSKVCFYTGKPLTLQLGVEASKSVPNRTTLDRIDHRLGYTNSNTVACCHAVNEWKNTAIEVFKIESRELSFNDLISVLTKLNSSKL